MRRKQSTTSSRHLRDSLTIISENIPNKRLCRVENNNDGGNNDHDGTLRTDHKVVVEEEQDLGIQRQEQQEQRKAYLRELLPVLVTGPLVAKSNPNKQQLYQDKTKEQEEDVPQQKQEQQQSSDYKVERLKELKRENEKVLQKRKDIFQRYAKLLSSYEYGLKYISNLKDLNQSPDNYMEGNFVDSSI
mmetsp:Transcript_2359/g.4397  ORF Transcript_2359/g.4397 Transcript_2359/m.4397 type:complete len:188 (-) Transcript_2359:35-598(-)